MSTISFKATLVGKNLVSDPFGGKNVKLELVEEREMPMPILIEGQGSRQELARELAPIVRQVVRSLPFARSGKVSIPRLTLWLTEDEWERLEPKPDIGDEVLVVVKGRNIEIQKI